MEEQENILFYEHSSVCESEHYAKGSSYPLGTFQGSCLVLDCK